jgi:glucose dehydrogenase
MTSAGMVQFFVVPVHAQSAPDHGQWTMPANDYGSTRYSGLTPITTANASNLKLSFTFSTGLTRRHEAVPLIAQNTMFIVTPWPNLLHGLELTKPGVPRNWRDSPQPPGSSQGVACCDVENRGAAHYKGRVHYNTLEMHTVAEASRCGRRRLAISIVVNR